VIIRELWDAIGRRSVGILDNVPKDQREAVTVVAFVVRWAQSDPRHQVVHVAADVGEDAGRDWAPSAFAFPDLGSFGDPLEDPLVADLWMRLNEEGGDDVWSTAAGTEPEWTDADGRPTSLTVLRQAFLALLPRGAARARARLRRRAGWGDEWTMFMVSDATWDQIYPGSASVNGGPLPPGLEDYLSQRSDGRAGL
jgi:hypothetical protein